MKGIYRFALLLVLAGMAAAPPAFAEADHISVGHDVTVADGDSADDVVCVLCSVRVRGEVKGDVVAVLGNVSVDSGRAVRGDVVTVGGYTSLGSGAVVNGDLVVVGGDLESGEGATVSGDRNIVSGRGWLLLPFAPLLVLAGVIWLIVWMVRRRRYTFPMYPQGRGF